MKIIPPANLKKIQRIKNVIDRGTPAIMEYIFELEDRIDTEIPAVKDILKRLKGDKGDNYIPTAKDKESFARIAGAQVDRTQIATQAAGMMNYEKIVDGVTKAMIPNIPKPIPGDTPSDAKLISLIKPLIPDPADSDGIAQSAAQIAIDHITPLIPVLFPITSIRDQFELLQGDNRLNVSAISGIEEMIDVKIGLTASGKKTFVGGSNGIQLYVDGVKQGLIKYLNLVSGTNVTLTPSIVNGMEVLTINASGGGGGSPVGGQYAVQIDNGDGTFYGSQNATITPDGQFSFQDGDYYSSTDGTGNFITLSAPGTYYQENFHNSSTGEEWHVGPYWLGTNSPFGYYNTILSASVLNLYDNGAVTTLNNTLDDGTGASIVSGTLVVGATVAAASIATFGDASSVSGLQPVNLLVADTSEAQFVNTQFNGNGYDQRVFFIISNNSDGNWYDNFLQFGVHSTGFSGNYQQSAIGASTDAGKGIFTFQSNNFSLTEVLIGASNYNSVPISIVSGTSGLSGIIVTFNIDNLGTTQFNASVTSPAFVTAGGNSSQVVLGDGTLGTYSAGTSFIDNEIVSGSATTFTLADTPIAGSVHVFGGGGRLTLGVDYSISGAVISILVGSYSAGQIVADYRI